MKIHSKKIIVVADKLQDMGGGETTLSQICEALNPELILTTTINKKHDWNKLLGGVKIVTPYWGKFVRNRYVWFIFYPIICYLMGRVSVYSDSCIFVYSSSASKFIKARSARKVILYSNFPARGVFFPKDFFKSKMVLFFISPFVKIFRAYEISCVKKYSDIYVISRASKLEYKKLMDIEATVLNCPTGSEFSELYKESGRHDNLSSQLPSEPRKTFVLVSRLVGWKNLDYIFQYFENQKKFKLNVIGDGPLFDYYRNKFNRNCIFFGYLSIAEKMNVMKLSYALIFPTVQEWSLVTIEASSLGLPVLGIECPGTVETQVIYTVNENLATCLTYKECSSESLSVAIKEFVTIDWNADFIYQHSKKYSPKEFEKNIKRIAGVSSSSELN